MARRDALLRLCRDAGWEPGWRETGPEKGSAARLSREAAARGADLVLACGGDGTVHGVLQGVAGTETALGVLPFGTANALARNLQLSLDPAEALRALLAGRPERIPLGQANAAGETRWFTVLAGAGPDGALVEAEAARARSKARWGRSAYYGRALRLLLSRRFPHFRVEYRLAGCHDWLHGEATAVLTGRVGDLGGVFGQVCAGSSLRQRTLAAQIVRGPAQLSLLAWIAMSHLRLGRWNPLLQRVEAEEIRCLPLRGRVAVQVDGEAFAELPLHLRVVDRALWLWLPGDEEA